MEDYYYYNCRADRDIASTNTCEFQEQILSSDMFGYEQCEFELRGLVMMSDPLKTQISSHPLYPNLVSAYIDCKKVGAPPEMDSLLEEICKENSFPLASAQVGADPELDNFMESYCKILQKMKEELTKPFDEATAYLNNIESQLKDICGGTLVRSNMDFNHSELDEMATGTSEEEISLSEVEAPRNRKLDVGIADSDLKEGLLRKYSGHLTSLRKEFLKKRKKGKLPEDARVTLLEWWNSHYRWPYPTEEDKMKLSEVTGLDPKQINNWFINQRKRHWKPSEDMRLDVMEGPGGSSMYFDFTSENGCDEF